MEAALSYNDQFGTDIDMERVYIEYRSNGFVVTGGRTHAELGYWNNAFHHGKWLQLTIDRPRVLRFEDDGGMLPVHQTGVTFEHGPPRGEEGLDVVLAVSNGQGPTNLGIQTNGDDNLAKALLLRIGGVGFARDTLRFGVNAMIDKIQGDSFVNPAGLTVPVYPLLPNANMTALITGAYLALRAEKLSVFSELYNVSARRRRKVVGHDGWLRGRRLPDREVHPVWASSKRGTEMVAPIRSSIQTPKQHRRRPGRPTISKRSRA